MMHPKFVLVIGIVAIAAPLHAATDGKLDCIRQARTILPVNLSAGVYTEKAQVTTPLKIEIPTSLDDQAYYECLVRNKIVDDRSANRYLARQDGCREQTRILQANDTDGNTRIGTTTNEARFHACMAVDSDITVEVEPEPR